MANLLTFSQFEEEKKSSGASRYLIIGAASRKIVRYKLREQVLESVKRDVTTKQIVSELNDTLRKRQDDKTYIEVLEDDVSSFLQAASARPDSTGKRKKSKSFADVHMSAAELVAYIARLLQDIEAGKDRLQALPYLQAMREALWLAGVFQDRFGKLVDLTIVMRNAINLKRQIYALAELTDDQKDLVMSVVHKTLFTDDVIHRPGSASVALPSPRDLANPG